MGVLAAYSTVTHERVATAGLTVPPGREGPSHARLRRLIETSFPNMTPARRRKLSELVGRLYTLRIDADYKPSVPVEAREVREASSLMTTIFDAFRTGSAREPSMPTQQEVPAIVAQVRQQLASAPRQGVRLEVSGERLDDDWLYVMVTPAEPGVRASDHAGLMSKVERHLRRRARAACCWCRPWTTEPAG